MDTTPYTVRKVMVKLTYDANGGGSVTYKDLLMIVDEVDPPITLNQYDTISVTWQIIYPKTIYTSNAWRTIKTLLGADGV